MNDILLKDGDLGFVQGDFITGNSESQVIEHLLLANKGLYKNAPLSGIGIGKMLNAPMSQIQRSSIARDVKLQLMAEGFKKIAVDIKNDGEITIDASL